MIFQAISPTSTSAPSAAIPAMPCRRRSPRRTRRPVKGRRATSVVASREVTIERDSLYYEWIFLICFLSKVTTGLGIGSKMSAGPNFCPFVIAQLMSFLMLPAFAPDDFCTSTYV
jgi:hypothetical protein